MSKKLLAVLLVSSKKDLKTSLFLKLIMISFLFVSSYQCLGQTLPFDNFQKESSGNYGFGLESDNQDSPELAIVPIVTDATNYIINNIQLKINFNVGHLSLKIYKSSETIPYVPTGSPLSTNVYSSSQTTGYPWDSGELHIVLEPNNRYVLVLECITGYINWETSVGTGYLAYSVTGYDPQAPKTYTSGAGGIGPSVYYKVSTAPATPTITTVPAILVSSTSARNVSGNIIDLGATSPTDHGFVWSTSPNPTTDLTTKITLGSKSATGTFASILTGLTPNTTYYVRGYATNSMGTNYSNEVVFSTNLNPVIAPINNSSNFVFNFPQQSLISQGNLMVKLFGSIFKPNSVFSIRLFSDPVTLATGTIDSNGTLDQAVILPAGTPSGLHHIVLGAELANGTLVQQEVPITVAEDGSVTYGNESVMMYIPENTTAVATILGSDADTPAQALTYSISGGADAAKFSINSTTGTLAFIAAPDFETPANANADNVYVLNVSVTDSGALNKSITNTLYLNVTNVAEIPLLSTPQSSPAATGASVSAVIVNDGGSSITNKGFVYSLTSVNSNPMIGGTGVTSVAGQMSGATAMVTTLTGLSSTSAYTFKAFAVNATGTAYTTATSFTTLGLNSAPYITYATPQNYLLNSVITNLAPANLGGSVPAGNYSKTSTFVGSGTGGNTNNANPLLAELDAPLGMVKDGNGNIYFSDQYNHRIKKIDGATGAVTQIAGATTPTPFLASASGSNDGTGIGNARFDSPSGIDYDGIGALYVADWMNNKIRKIVLATGVVSTVAGGGTGSQSGYTNATGTAARFLSPTDVKYRVESSIPYLYVTDAGNHCIRKINLGTNAVTTFAGVNTSGTTEGDLATARFNTPTGMVFSSTGVLYVVDRGNNKIRKIDNGTVSTLAGSGTNATTSGTGAAAAFADPFGITIDGAGNLYVTQALKGSYPTSNPGFSITNASNNYIRKITPSGEVTIFAGSGARGAADNDSRLLATLGFPAFLLFDSGKNILYVSEWYSDKIRKIELGGYAVDPALPAGLSFNNTTGEISGTPTAKNEGPVNYTVTGYNYYGSSTATVAITTGILPSLNTTAVADITATTATSGGNVTNNGVSNAPPIDGGGSPTPLIERGICWSTSTNPTVSDSKVADSVMMTGSFTSNLTGLAPLTTYYVRAYATNVLGTAYGTEMSFTT